MRYLTAAALVCLAAAGTAYAQPPDPQIVVPVTAFIDAFNKGDVAAAAATHAAGADIAILDEVPPYLWRGPKAFESWMADLDAEAKKQGQTDHKVVLGAVTRVETIGDDAYVIVPTAFTFKQQGVAMNAKAQVTVVLKKGASGWKIHAWTWTGPRPQKVAVGK